MDTNFELPERIRRSVSALKDAVNRFEKCRTSQMPADSFAVLAETLDWITKLDNDLYKLCGQAYRSKRDKHQFGKAVVGHRLARDLDQHNARTVDLVNVTRGVQFPVRPPICPWELKWKVRTDLPDPDEHDANYISAYDHYVAARLVRVTFSEMLEFFSEVIENTEGWLSSKGT